MPFTSFYKVTAPGTQLANCHISSTFPTCCAEWRVPSVTLFVRYLKNTIELAATKTKKLKKTDCESNWFSVGFVPKNTAT